MTESAPKFVRFVSPVKGRLVSRWDAPVGYFGARRATNEERAADGEPLVWNESAVIPLTEQFVARYSRELHNALRAGDLKERERKDWEACLAAEEKAEEARVAEVEKLNAEAEKPEAEAAAQQGAAAEESKPEGRKKK